MITGRGPKNLIGGGLLDTGPGHLVEDGEQGRRLVAGVLGGSAQGGDAGCRRRATDDLEQATSDREADAFGLGDGGEVLLHLRGEQDGTSESFLERPNLGLLAVELLAKLVDLGLGDLALDGLNDLMSLTVEGLAGLGSLLSQGGDTAITAAQNRETAGDELRKAGHGIGPVQADEG